MTNTDRKKNYLDEASKLKLQAKTLASKLLSNQTQLINETSFVSEFGSSTTDLSKFLSKEPVPKLFERKNQTVTKKIPSSSMNSSLLSSLINDFIEDDADFLLEAETSLPIAANVTLKANDIIIIGEKLKPKQEDIPRLVEELFAEIGIFNFPIAGKLLRYSIETMSDGENDPYRKKCFVYLVLCDVSLFLYFGLYLVFLIAMCDS